VYGVFSEEKVAVETRVDEGVVFDNTDGTAHAVTGLKNLSVGPWGTVNFVDGSSLDDARIEIEYVKGMMSTPGSAVMLQDVSGVEVWNLKIVLVEKVQGNSGAGELPRLVFVQGSFSPETAARWIADASPGPSYNLEVQDVVFGDIFQRAIVGVAKPGRGPGPNDGGLGTGAVVGIVVAVLLAVTVLGVLVYFKRVKDPQISTSTSTEDSVFSEDDEENQEI
jgi:hypothetical protein